MENIDKSQGDSKKEEGLKIADRFAIAMFSPKEYGALLKENTGKLIGFLVLLFLLVSVIRYGVPALGTIAGMGGIDNIILREVPDFSLEKGELRLDDRYENRDDLNGIYMLADTDVESFRASDVPEGMVQAIMISRTNILVYNSLSGMAGQVQENKFSDFGDISLDNQSLTQFSGVIYVSLAFLFVMLYIFEAVKYLAVGLFYSLVFLLYSRIFAIPTPFERIYKTSMYAQAIGTVVYAITCCINSSALIFAGSIFEVLISFSIMRRVLLPIGRPIDFLQK